MLQEAPHELHDVKAGNAHAAAAGFAVFEENPPVFKLDDAVVGNGHPENIGGQILETAIAGADGLAVHIPISLPYGFINELVKPGRFHFSTEFGLEDL